MDNNYKFCNYIISKIWGLACLLTFHEFECWFSFCVCVLSSGETCPCYASMEQVMLPNVSHL